MLLIKLYFLFFKERHIEDVKKILVVSLYLHLEEGNTLCLSQIFCFGIFVWFWLLGGLVFFQILICSYGINGKIWEPSSGENNVSGFDTGVTFL